jgi:hypothetical protein
MTTEFPFRQTYYFCDESSFMNDTHMAVAGMAISEADLPLIRAELQLIRERCRAGGEIKWSNTDDKNVRVREEYINLMWRLIRGRRAHLHLRFAPFGEYDHHLYERRRFDTASRMFYQLLLHKAVRHYGARELLFIRPDNGPCTEPIPKLKYALLADSKKYNRHPECIDSIECLESAAEPMLQLLDVSLGAFAALRNDRKLKGGKRHLADHAAKSLGVRNLAKDYDEGVRFSIWNAIPSRRSNHATIR